MSYKDVKEGIAILYLSASKAMNEVGDLLFIWLLERHAVKARAIDRVGILNYWKRDRWIRLLLRRVRVRVALGFGPMPRSRSSLIGKSLGYQPVTTWAEVQLKPPRMTY